MKHQEHIISVFADVAAPSTRLIDSATVNIQSKDVVIMQRALLETNPKFRQLIPYVVVKQGDKYLAYERSKSGGESRLHNLFSIGIGGHVDAVDAVYDEKGVFQLTDTLRTGMYRELHEELGLTESDFLGMTTIGYLSKDLTPVDEVHLGIVLVAEVHADLVVTSKEDALNLAGFLTAGELAKLNLESWSETVVAELV
ncbi:NUDIX domain-containing protein [Moritella sp.]|uniref:NUDIX domain-containing protein n=1 Tax=Moritella sp. TaxID=78556 RepID=UPI001DE9BF00|nr:NUDIX domain-containing protein [Moritella sp.]MCJ8350350.1 NUDIX domain-containing protein [Moritella sp.]NQZ40045.1 NUDIX domain-containing protein [Moritella sp.]